MTTIEKLLETISALESIARSAIELADEYSGNESETATQLREHLEAVLLDHHADD
jgi:hypothetical protein